MFMHLGQDIVVPQKDVIGIFNMDNTTGSHITRKFLSDAEKSGRVAGISGEMPNSFVVCDREVYLSQLSSQTLQKRFEAMKFD